MQIALEPRFCIMYSRCSLRSFVFARHKFLTKAQRTQCNDIAYNCLQLRRRRRSCNAAAICEA